MVRRPLTGHVWQQRSGHERFVDILLATRACRLNSGMHTLESRTAKMLLLLHSVARTFARLASALVDLSGHLIVSLICSDHRLLSHAGTMYTHLTAPMYFIGNREKLVANPGKTAVLYCTVQLNWRCQGQRQNRTKGDTKVQKKGREKKGLVSQTITTV